MTIKYKFGVVDSTRLSLLGRRYIDSVCDTLEEAFTEAAGFIDQGAQQISIVRCKLNKTGDDWIDAGDEEEITIDARYVGWISDCTDDSEDEQQTAAV